MITNGNGRQSGIKSISVFPNRESLAVKLRENNGRLVQFLRNRFQFFARSDACLTEQNEACNALSSLVGRAAPYTCCPIVGLYVDSILDG